MVGDLCEPPRCKRWKERFWLVLQIMDGEFLSCFNMFQDWCFLEFLVSWGQLFEGVPLGTPSKRFPWDSMRVINSLEVVLRRKVSPGRRVFPEEEGFFKEESFPKDKCFLGEESFYGEEGFPKNVFPATKISLRRKLFLGRKVYLGRRVFLGKRVSLKEIHGLGFLWEVVAIVDCFSRDMDLSLRNLFTCFNMFML